MSLLIFLIVLMVSFGFIMTMISLSRENLAKKNKPKETRPVISDTGVRELVTQGQIDDAIELYRRFTGVDMFTAKSAIDEMVISVGLEDEMRRLVNLGDKTAALELYQRVFGETPSAALAAIEALEQQKGR